MLKIFVADYGVEGCTVCVTDTIEKARELMVRMYGLKPDVKDIEQHEIKDGFCYDNLGDS